MTLQNVETHFSEIFCCAEAKLFSSKTYEGKFKLLKVWRKKQTTNNNKYPQTNNTHTRREEFIFIFSQAVLEETSKI